MSEVFCPNSSSFSDRITLTHLVSHLLCGQYSRETEDPENTSTLFLSHNTGNIIIEKLIDSDYAKSEKVKFDHIIGFLMSWLIYALMHSGNGIHSFLST